MKKTSSFFAALAIGILAMALPARAQNKQLPQITAADVSVHPYCSVAASQILDPKSKDIFDELDVTVTRGEKTRIRIDGKKKKETGYLEGRPVLHTGKIALVPFAQRSGTLVSKLQTTVDVRTYYICIGLSDKKLKTKNITVEKGTVYKWTIHNVAGETVFRVTDPADKEIATISVPADQTKSFGIGATVRWQDGEADLAMTLD